MFEAFHAKSVDGKVFCMKNFLVCLLSFRGLKQSIVVPLLLEAPTTKSWSKEKIFSCKSCSAPATAVMKAKAKMKRLKLNV